MPLTVSQTSIVSTIIKATIQQDTTKCTKYITSPNFKSNGETAIYCDANMQKNYLSAQTLLLGRRSTHCIQAEQTPVHSYITTSRVKATTLQKRHTQSRTNTSTPFYHHGEGQKTAHSSNTCLSAQILQGRRSTRYHIQISNIEACPLRYYYKSEGNYIIKHTKQAEKTPVRLEVTARAKVTTLRNKQIWRFRVIRQVPNPETKHKDAPLTTPNQYAIRTIQSFEHIRKGKEILGNANGWEEIRLDTEFTTI